MRTLKPALALCLLLGTTQCVEVPDQLTEEQHTAVLGSKDSGSAGDVPDTGFVDVAVNIDVTQDDIIDAEGQCSGESASGAVSLEVAGEGQAGQGTHPKDLVVDASSKRAYIASSKGLLVYDLAAETPQKITDVEPGTYFRAIDGDSEDSAFAHVFVITQTGGNLSVFNVETPTEPALAGTVNVGSDSASDVVVQTGFAYVARGSEFFGVVDVTSPQTPTVVGQLSGDEVDGIVVTDATCVAIQGDLAFIGAKTDNSFTSFVFIIDVSTPESPTVIGHFAETGASNIYGLQASGNRLYVGEDSKVGFGPPYYNRLRVLGLEDPTKPKSLGIWNLPQPNAPAIKDYKFMKLQVIGHAVYAAIAKDFAPSEGSLDEVTGYGGGLVILDAAEPSDIQLVAEHWVDPGMTVEGGLNVSGLSVTAESLYLTTDFGLRRLTPGCPECGVPCDDGNPCNGAESCGPAGICVSTAPPTCDDENPCTADTCDASAEGGCVHTSDGEICDDGNPCTADTCDPVDGCLHSPTDEGEPCDDGDACTLETACDAGTCDCGDGCASPDCDDGNPCTADTCDPVDGCLHSPTDEGEPCDDGDACTLETACDAGTCDCGDGCASPDCDDGNPCTADSCDANAEGGCVHTPDDSLNCDDGDPCTEPDTCVTGECKAGPEVDACSSVTPDCEATLELIEVNEPPNAYHDLEIQGGRAFAAAQGAPLVIMDLAGGALPLYPLNAPEGAGTSTRVSVSGDYAYTVHHLESEGGDPHVVSCWSVADSAPPSNPTHCGTFGGHPDGAVVDNFNAREVIALGSHALVLGDYGNQAEDGSVLWMVSFQQGSPKGLSYLELGPGSTSPRMTHWAGQHRVYVGTGEGTVRIVDISDPFEITVDKTHSLGFPDPSLAGPFLGLSIDTVSQILYATHSKIFRTYNASSLMFDEVQEYPPITAAALGAESIVAAEPVGGSVYLGLMMGEGLHSIQAVKGTLTQSEGDPIQSFGSVSPLGGSLGFIEGGGLAAWGDGLYQVHANGLARMDVGCLAESGCDAACAQPGPNPCHVGMCDPSDGSCFYKNGGCSDGDPCTMDTCSAVGEGALCVATETNCDTCEFDADCDDGNPCSDNDCYDGYCWYDFWDCDDNDPCTTDACDPATGECTNQAQDGCTPTLTTLFPLTGSPYMNAGNDQQHDEPGLQIGTTVYVTAGTDGIPVKVKLTYGPDSGVDPVQLAFEGGELEPGATSETYFYTTIPDGASVELVGQALDADDNPVGAPSPMTFYLVDVSPPTITGLGFNDGEVLNTLDHDLDPDEPGLQVYYGFQVSDPTDSTGDGEGSGLANVSVFLNGGALWGVAPQQETLETQGLLLTLPESTGIHELKVVATDVAGNETTEEVEVAIHNTHLVVFKDGGFEPADLTVTEGDYVRFQPGPDHGVEQVTGDTWEETLSVVVSGPMNVPNGETQDVQITSPATLFYRCSAHPNDPSERGLIRTCEGGCDDGDPCSDDTCDESGTCVSTPKVCDDGDPCSDDSCDEEGTCVFTPKVCDDGQPCTIDSCEPAAGVCSSESTVAVAQASLDGHDFAELYETQPIHVNPLGGCTSQLSDNFGFEMEWDPEGFTYTGLTLGALTVRDDGWFEITGTLNDVSASLFAINDYFDGCENSEPTSEQQQTTHPIGYVASQLWVTLAFSPSTGESVVLEAAGFGLKTTVDGPCEGSPLSAICNQIGYAADDAVPGLIREALAAHMLQVIPNIVDANNPTEGCGDSDACVTNTCTFDGVCATAALDCGDQGACVESACDSSVGCVLTPVICDDGQPCTMNVCDDETGCDYPSIVSQAQSDLDNFDSDAATPLPGTELTSEQVSDVGACGFGIVGLHEMSMALEWGDGGLDYPTLTIEPIAVTDTGYQVTARMSDASVQLTAPASADFCDGIASSVEVEALAALEYLAAETWVTANFTLQEGALNPDLFSFQTGSTGVDSVIHNSECTSAVSDFACGNVIQSLEGWAADAARDEVPQRVEEALKQAVSESIPALLAQHLTPSACDDDNHCTVDLCDTDGQCGNDPLTCDDNNLCTLDSCNPVTGCHHESITCSGDNTACDSQQGCVCAGGYGDCDGVGGNGCETDLTQDVLHCGGCEDACGKSDPHALYTCSAGQCDFEGCQPGWCPDTPGGEDCSMAMVAAQGEACEDVLDLGDIDGQDGDSSVETAGYGPGVVRLEVLDPGQGISAQMGAVITLDGAAQGYSIRVYEGSCGGDLLAASDSYEELKNGFAVTWGDFFSNSNTKTLYIHIDASEEASCDEGWELRVRGHQP